MHVFSREQFQKLIDESNYKGPWTSLLDLGAGDGAITANIAELFGKVFTTDISAPMRWALQKRKYMYVFAFFFLVSILLFLITVFRFFGKILNSYNFGSYFIIFIRKYQLKDSKNSYLRNTNFYFIKFPFK